ncbi:YeeE/YedE thiosulfate transporter family protein [Congregibacter variabilis]|uniref:YeeE/YedE thiosulfate transporter family protein n=1 Tax=Congregibacter variabilis TaxID=3081200 RepID=A0ABZ0HZK1_9GAMM|nr:YeeE/YedE thiosulfate transporter family protein [Congregibacter sp. IMCC43200]
MNKDFIISWKAAGISLGLLLIIATALVKPLGVSTQFVVTDGMVAHKVAPEFAESNTYLAKYGEQDDWGVGYGWMLVFGMIVGGGVTAQLLRRRQPDADKGSIPELWQNAFGPSHVKRYLASFFGGVLLLFGARLAGGCTSGHMISGISQLALSSFIFGVITFVSAILMAKFLYRGRV